MTGITGHLPRLAALCDTCYAPLGGRQHHVTWPLCLRKNVCALALFLGTIEICEGWGGIKRALCRSSPQYKILCTDDLSRGLERCVQDQRPRSRPSHKWPIPA